MKYLFIVIFLGSFFSCNYYEKKKLNSETILMEELKTFNWNELDSYPSFETCDDSIDFQETKMCFEQTLISHFSEFFTEKNLVVTENVTDTIRIDFLVNNKGSLSISNIQSKPLTRLQIPTLDSLITHSLQGLPKLYPAIKRSQQVQSAFQLPLILVVK